MRIRLAMAVLGFSGLLTLLTGAAASASAPMKWNSPNEITFDSTFVVSSITPCPALPNAADTMEVQISVAYSAGGGSGQILSTNPDGSWSGPVRFIGSPLGKATLTADCIDVNGTTGTTYASYQPHKVKVVNPKIGP